MPNLTTAYGSALDTPQRAAALLRAVANRMGLPLAPTSDSDLAAATLAAHCWVLKTGNTNLSGPFTPTEAAGIVPALSRAAGHGEEPEDNYHITEVIQLCEKDYGAINPVIEWAIQKAGASSVLCASYDLANTTYTPLLHIARHLGAVAYDSQTIEVK